MERKTGKNPRRTVRVFGVGLIVVLAAGAVAAPGPSGGRAGYGGGGGTPTPTPTPTATATPTATPTPAPDTTPPTVSSVIGRGQTARSIVRRGFEITIACTEDCTHVTQLYVSRSQARKLRIKPKATRRVLVGKRTSLLKANVNQKIRVKLNRKAKRGVRRMKRKHVRRLRLTVAQTAHDAANNFEHQERTFSFKR